MDELFYPLLGLVIFAAGVGLGWLLGKTQLPNGPAAGPAPPPPPPK